MTRLEMERTSRSRIGSDGVDWIVMETDVRFGAVRSTERARATNEEVYHNFRFWKEDLVRLHRYLRMPEQFVTGNATVSSFEGLLVFLRRMAFPNRWNDLVPLFGLSRTQMSGIFYAVLDFIEKMGEETVTYILEEDESQIPQGTVHYIYMAPAPQTRPPFQPPTSRAQTPARCRSQTPARAQTPAGSQTPAISQTTSRPPNPFVIRTRSPFLEGQSWNTGRMAPSPPEEVMTELSEEDFSQEEPEDPEGDEDIPPKKKRSPSAPARLGVPAEEPSTESPSPSVRPKKSAPPPLGIRRREQPEDGISEQMDAPPPLGIRRREQPLAASCRSMPGPSGVSGLGVHASRLPSSGTVAGESVPSDEDDDLIPRRTHSSLRLMSFRLPWKANLGGGELRGQQIPGSRPRRPRERRSANIEPMRLFMDGLILERERLELDRERMRREDEERRERRRREDEETRAKIVFFEKAAAAVDAVKEYFERKA
ncbi:unnamed protein product [Cyprideis torosa]|uniref:Uncharacterized protein n=1 Tax=Cyprideis torosa TaxID=163714 RepID=A0A7R8WF61_9CRUS|nr:unnamed protein product [Cyprideis torosa]CAG0896636.1 unnamed protein product [Cyprideis torosa]